MRCYSRCSMQSVPEVVALRRLPKQHAHVCEDVLFRHLQRMGVPTAIPNCYIAAQLEQLR